MQYLFLAMCSLAVLFTSGCTSRPSVEQLKSFAATETYPEDRFLDTVTDKKALIIVAHDDDDCGMSGTISKLTAAGWRIQQLSLVKHSMDGENGENPAKIICEGNKVLLDGEYRLGEDTMKAPYMPIPLADMEAQYLQKKMAEALTTQINAFKPTVVFTLDNVKGGYGHPDHIVISQLVVDIFQTRETSIQRIYQSVYTDHMEEQIVDTWLKAKMERWGYPHASPMANELYGIDGMPEPTVQVNIKDFAATKMKYLRAYPEKAGKNLRKFVPYFEDFDAETYFSVFDREFFRVIQ